MDDTLKRVQTLLREIGPLLTGQGAAVQGAVLADLLAMWIAGHVLPDSENKTRQTREELLAGHIAVVRDLVPENAKSLGLPGWSFKN